ncbi:MAG: biotin/lipoyl-binding protein [Hymenobacteraceae bacterium]|nr:biotin/lipoyl-binding protein [Hymenobacteraceae bacterium]
MSFPLHRALPGLLYLLLLSACQSRPPDEEADAEGPPPRAQVRVTTVTTQALEDHVTLPATAVYPSKSAVTASLAGYITAVHVQLGDRVQAGQVLFGLETKERRALGSAAERIDPSLRGFGLVTVRAPAAGIVSILDQAQAGGYVLEGAPLCTVAESSGFVFQLNLPYEYHALATGHPRVTILLPDSTRHTGTVTAPLASVSVGQAEVWLVKPDKPPGIIPENLTVQVLLTRTRRAAAQTLPATCVLADETLHNFWVMKLVDDSTAVKVPVTLGVQRPDEIEILRPAFAPQDRILRTGNYGLADTAKVTVLR